MLTALIALASLSYVAAQGGQACNATSLCPSTAPCCSSYGFCGVGAAFCLGGCNPLTSHTPGSCKPMPMCQSGTYSFANLDRVQTNLTYWDGNVTKYDWTVDSGNVIPGSDNNSMVMTLSEANMGTKLSSTRYVHYGKISSKVKTGKWAGVVTAAITMSDMKDEIDWEFPGQNTTNGQSNFFWEGNIPDLTQGDVHGVSSDTSANWHTYSVDWQPETLTFAIDGKTVRVVNKNDTAAADGANGYKYPSTPARIQLSIWPGGANTSAPGTIKWAGGPINFNDPDYVAAGGHFYASVAEVDVTCNDPVAAPQGATGYVYGTNASTTDPKIAFTNVSTLLNGAMPRALALPANVLSAGALAIGIAIFGQFLA